MGKADVRLEKASFGLELRRGEEGIEGMLVGRGEERVGNSRKRERRIKATAKAIIGARKLMGLDGIMGDLGTKEFTFFSHVSSRFICWAI